ncbi:MAG TPA: phenylalanine--tRNA ligase subunit beta [Armatimonadetes bacterium]|nr:phenylalanine--tRNA ligase subunit beta [Armatimonadota bacterium]
MMRIPTTWLSDYLSELPPTDELAALLTDLGLEIEFIEDAPAGLGGQVLVAEITPNRGDCLSMIGVAREVAARTGAELRLPTIELTEDPNESIEGQLEVLIDDGDLCPRYSARIIADLHTGPSPKWMQDRLLACGQRPIDLLVDVTNYVLFELGQPLHAFDADELGSTILVRRAAEGEMMTTLDGVERKLTPDQLLITDGQRPVALAGVMGGANTAIGASTTRVVIESAHFLAPNIRRTARNLGLESESSYRFSRVVDPSGTVRAADRCAQLLVQCGGGRVLRGVVDTVAQPIGPVTIDLRPAMANRFLGLELSDEQMADMLRRLQLEVEPTEAGLRVIVPTVRPDLTREVDLIEEIARLHGYNNVPATTPPAAQKTGQLNARQKAERRVRELCLAAGLNEVWTFSLTSVEAMGRAGYAIEAAPAGVVSLQNALSADFALLRWALLPSMLEVVGHNATAHGSETRVFEVGRAYFALDHTVTDQRAAQAGRVATVYTAETLPLPCRERLTLAGAITGRAYTSAWNLAPELFGADVTEIKGLFDLLLDELRVEGVQAEPYAHPAFEPHRAGRLMRGRQPLAVWGEVAPSVLAAFDIRRPVVAFELDLDLLLDSRGGLPTYRGLPRFPAALRDVALVVPDEYSQAQVAASITAASEHLESLRLFDVYRGVGLPAGTRSLAYALTFRRAEGTLTDETVDADMERIVEQVAADCRARLRA